MCVSRTGWGPRPALPRASACVCGLGAAGSAPRPSALVSSVSRRPPGCSQEHTPQNVLQVLSGRVRHSGELGVQAVPTSPVSVSVRSPALTPPSPWRQAGRHVALSPARGGSRSSFCEMSASTKAGPTFSLTARLCMGDSGLTTPTLLCGFRVCGSWLASAGRWSWLTRAVSRSLLVLFSHTRLFDWFWGAHPHGLQSLLTHNALVCAASGGLPPYPRGLRALSFLQVGLAPGTHGHGGLAAEVC